MNDYLDKFNEIEGVIIKTATNILSCIFLCICLITPLGKFPAAQLLGYVMVSNSFSITLICEGKPLYSQNPPQLKGIIAGLGLFVIV